MFKKIAKNSLKEESKRELKEMEKGERKRKILKNFDIFCFITFVFIIKVYLFLMRITWC